MVLGFYYSLKNLSPIIEDRPVCFYEKNNVIDVFTIKLCKKDGTVVGHLPPELSWTSKFVLDRRASISVVLTFTHYRRSSLVQGSMKISYKVTVEMSPNLKNAQLLDRLMELIKNVHSEPKSSIIFGSFLSDENEVKFLSNEAHETKAAKLFDIRETYVPSSNRYWLEEVKSWR